MDYINLFLDENMYNCNRGSFLLEINFLSNKKLFLLNFVSHSSRSNLKSSLESINSSADEQTWSRIYILLRMIDDVRVTI